MPNYQVVVDKEFENDLKFILDYGYVAQKDLTIFKNQLDLEQSRLDKDWEGLSRATEYPPHSIYDYRKRYFHSIPEAFKKERGWTDMKADFRIVFKVREERKEIFYLGIGPRIQELPKNPDDVWARLKQRPIPEES
ncbi:hypothetical protein [Planococcus sp. ISL-109]|uniref:hypothetical protein n=1 Tax=Planococcus sp. ISL-109 TaxID=2819166 RepID=UPI001BE89064|nr:hypothetical protein [Planococcus sp. ISL-109]MBT2582893.1 hypothetical protein [Planococcus sp. ISL-109]